MDQSIVIELMRGAIFGDEVGWRLYCRNRLLTEYCIRVERVSPARDLRNLADETMDPQED